MILITGKDGYSLLELILVFAILTTMVGITIPSFRGTITKERLKSSAGDLVAAINYAHGLSVMKGYRHRMICDLDKGSYRIAIEKDPQKSPGQFDQVQSHECRERYLPKGIRFELISTEQSSARRGIVSVDFRPDGTCTGHTIRVTSRFEESLAIQTFGNTCSTVVQKFSI